MTSYRTIAVIVGLVLMALAFTIIPGCVREWRSERAQSRVDNAQAGAAQTSAGEAINTVAASGQSEAASEDLTRSNERDIRSADGAGERVGAPVDLAGRRALCRRAAYATDPRCAMSRQEGSK
ncbi:hypothetical protein [Sphingomonas sp. LY160]|uniref:hypothetical protein n=1 Tax=Sphingomonas sp. LY160 TaxID=3095342 RepID=UPI002ADEC15F|nr:hypothetical protein [Sphingomonas sp. LY160]MEA1071296.1 hypothetical protein [Sphingomonas sp. LY160]